MLYPTFWKSYELIDTGEGRKLERFGNLVVDRPELSAPDRKGSITLWDLAKHKFTEEKGQKGSWNTEFSTFKSQYQERDQSFEFLLKQTAFKHLGIFPEQAINWRFIVDQCAHFQEKSIQPRILNLFAYTGAASVIAARFGAEVTHIDSSKTIVNWARENASLNNISSIRWIVEDARKFVDRCIKRGDKYNGVILDPPIFGMVPKGKNWKLNSDLAPLLRNILKILDDDNRFLVLNTYSPQLPMHKLNELLGSLESFPKKYEATSLGLRSTTGKKLELGNLIRFTTLT